MPTFLRMAPYQVHEFCLKILFGIWQPCLICVDWFSASLSKVILGKLTSLCVPGMVSIHWWAFCNYWASTTNTRRPPKGVYKLMHSENIHSMHTVRLGFSGLSRAMVTKNWWIDGCKEGKLSLSDKSCSSVQLRFFWLAFHSFHFHNLSQQTRPPHTLIGFHTVTCHTLVSPHIENHSLSDSQ